MTKITHERFATLDVFRGMTIFLMIIVNTQGSGAIPYPAMEHSAWNGCTLTDLVFPSFLFAVGNAMPFAIKKLQGQPGKIVLYKIFKRTFLIFLVGYLLGWYASMHWSNGHLQFYGFSQTRIMAVLQRIALCYFIGSLIIYCCSLRWIFAWSVVFLFAYWMLLYTLGEPGMQYTIFGNAVRKIDLLLLGEQHMYRERGIVFDPEGLLSTIPATVNVLAGYLTGAYIIKKGRHSKTVIMPGITGCLLILSGLFWDITFPMNKKLWTSSYVLFATGVDLLTVCILFYIIEIKHWVKGANFFAVLGKNPLFIYVLSNLFLFFLIIPIKDKIFIDWINEVVFQKIAPGPFGALLFAVSFAMFFWWIAWIMDKKKIYIRL